MISLDTVAGVAGTSYMNPVMTVDSYGRITGITSGPAITATGGTGIDISGSMISLDLFGAGATIYNTYLSSITVDDYGRITMGSTAAAALSATTGSFSGSLTVAGSTVLSIAGAGLTKSGATISLDTVAGVSGTYSYPNNVVVNPRGQITSITNGVAPIIYSTKFALGSTENVTVAVGTTTIITKGITSDVSGHISLISSLGVTGIDTHGVSTQIFVTNGGGITVALSKPISYTFTTNSTSYTFAQHAGTTLLQPGGVYTIKMNVTAIGNSFNVVDAHVSAYANLG